MTRHYRKGDAVDVTIEKIVSRGFGLGFAENLTVLVPLAAPGDVLRVRIREIKKRTAFGEIVGVLEAGPRRVEPPCRYFGVCGGCDMQQLDYGAQLDAKVEIVRDNLRRIGKIDDTGIKIKLIPSPHEFEYRSRARWHFNRRRGVMGYLKRNSHDIIDVTECPILTPGLGSAFQYARESMEWDAPDQTGEIEAATGDEGHASILSDPGKPAELSFAVDGENYAFSAATFFQANKFLIAELIEAAVGGTEGNTAFDLYCGVGLFTLPLARAFQKVLAVEGNKASVDLAKKNVESIRAANVKIIASSVERFLDRNKIRKVDLIVLDPPRTGPENGTIEKIARLSPAEVSYVSCEPSILARDLRILLDAGYQIDSITVLDMFPQTHHVETVARLSVAEARA